MPASNWQSSLLKPLNIKNLIKKKVTILFGVNLRKNKSLVVRADFKPWFVLVLCEALPPTLYKHDKEGSSSATLKKVESNVVLSP